MISDLKYFTKNLESEDAKRGMVIGLVLPLTCKNTHF